MVQSMYALLAFTNIYIKFLSSNQTNVVMNYFTFMLFNYANHIPYSGANGQRDLHPHALINAMHHTSTQHTLGHGFCT